LNSIIVGEDTFKDCVTIVLFRSILRLENMESPNKFVFYWYTPFQVLLNFVYLIIGSFLLAVVAAMATTYLFKKMRFLLNDKGVSETSLLFLLGLTCYVLA
jgi:NhaP-type Na+/H+ or K+/H+ antiporter